MNCARKLRLVQKRFGYEDIFVPAVAAIQLLAATETTFMRKRPLLFLIYILTLCIGCGTDRTLYTNIDGSGALFLSHHTASIPVLGPCGFSRSKDVYEIELPRRNGKIDCSELKIHYFDTDTVRHYTGFIEFVEPGKIKVELFKTINGKMMPLTINGYHKLKVEDNMIGDRKI